MPTILANTELLLVLEADGTDTSGNSRDAVENGTVPFNSSPTPPFGTNWAGPFTDTNYYTTSAGFNTAFSNLSAWRIEVYFEATSFANAPVIFNRADGGNRSFQILPSGAFRWIDVGGTVDTSAGDAVINTTHHLVFGFDGTTRYIYLDDCLIKTSATSAATGTVTTCWIGRFAVTTLALSGQLKYLRVVSVSPLGLDFPSMDTPDAITAVTASSSQIDLTMTDNGPTARNLFYQSLTDSSGAALPVDWALPGGQAGTAAGLASSTPHFFFMRTQNEFGGLSPFTPSATDTTSAGAAVPNDPTSPAAVALSSSKIKVTWVDSNGVTYNVYRSLTDSFGASTLVACVIPGVQTFTDTGLPVGTKQFYFIEASNTAGVSSPTASVNATTDAVVKQVEEIRQAILDRVAAVLGATWHVMEYPREIEKISRKQANRGYNVLISGGGPSDATVFKSTTIERAFQVILSKNVVQKKNENAVTVIEDDLENELADIAADVVHTKLGLDTFVVQVLTPSPLAPELLDEGNVVVSRFDFPVQYRTTVLT